MNQLNQGNIIIEEIQCTFPNGQNFSYNYQWKQFNGINMMANDNQYVYELSCNLEDFRRKKI